MPECPHKLTVINQRTHERWQVPCKRCICCRKKKAAAIKRFCEYEQQKYYRMGLSCSFNCLTYNDAREPRNSRGIPTLRKSDYQLFFMRFRNHLRRSGYTAPFSYLGCGEYSDYDRRPHYHLILFGISDILADKFIRKSWMTKDTRSPIGIVDCKPLIAGGISYVCDYVITSLSGDYAKAAYDDNEIERPFFTHSKGLGLDYLFGNQEILEENNFVDNFSGKPYVIPGYYRKYYNLGSVDPKPILSAVHKKAKSLGLSDSEYQVQQSYIASKNALLQSQQSACPVENEFLSPREEIGRCNDSEWNNLILDTIDPIPF